VLAQIIQLTLNENRCISSSFKYIFPAIFAVRFKKHETKVLTSEEETHENSEEDARQSRHSDGH